MLMGNNPSFLLMPRQMWGSARQRREKNYVYVSPLLSSPPPGSLLQPPSSQDSTAVTGTKTFSVSVSFLPPHHCKLPPMCVIFLKCNSLHLHVHVHVHVRVSLARKSPGRVKTSQARLPSPERNNYPQL